jgi:glucokinase
MRPSVVERMREDVVLGDSLARCAVGLDIGGTKTAGGIIAADGRITLQETISTLSQRGGEAVADDAFQLAQRLTHQAEELGQVPTAIGVSICELVSREGTIVSDETIQWRGLAVERRLSRLKPTVIETDSRAAALCESRYGAARDFPIFLYVTIGTGISCSLVIDGQPFVGARGMTGTMATGPLTIMCSACGTLSAVVVERIAAGPAIRTRYNELAHSMAEGCESVLTEADRGNAIARDVILTASECVGSVIGLLVSVLDPHAVVVGGGLGSAAGLYWESLQAATRRHIWSPAHRQLPIVQGAYGNRAAMVGAALVALDRQPAGRDFDRNGSDRHA